MELNLQQNATLLLNADLNLSKKEFSLRGNQFIEDVIGDDKVNIIVAIYNQRGHVMYKNDNAAIFDIQDSLGENFSEWEDVEKKEYLIKYLTVRDQNHGRIIKVGMILNQSLLRWKDLNQRIFLYGAIILSLILLLSFFLTHALFKPVHKLAQQVNLLGDKIERGEFQDIESWFPALKGQTNSSDEFYTLISALQKLAHKIANTQILTQRWSALMAHELKTPMTILKMSIENLVIDLKVPPEKVESVEMELKKLEDIIMDFLEWASAENETSNPVVHALHLDEKCREVIDHYVKAYRVANIHFHSESAHTLIFCNPIHFEQLLTNLLKNAHKHGGGKINVIAGSSFLIVEDQGPGLPIFIRDNFGKPFNKGNNRTEGHGLGLAWVNTIARKYDWKITILSGKGTHFKISFPSDF